MTDFASSNFAGVLVIGTLAYLWSTIVRQAHHEKVPMAVGNPSAEPEVDPTRWRHDGAQDITDYSGNRPGVSDEHTQWLFNDINAATGFTPRLPPKLVTNQHSQSGTTAWATLRADDRTPHPETPADPTPPSDPISSRLDPHGYTVG